MDASFPGENCLASSTKAIFSAEGTRGRGGNKLEEVRPELDRKWSDPFRINWWGVRQREVGRGSTLPLAPTPHRWSLNTQGNPQPPPPPHPSSSSAPSSLSSFSSPPSSSSSEDTSPGMDPPINIRSYLNLTLLTPPLPSFQGQLPTLDPR